MIKYKIEELRRRSLLPKYEIDIKEAFDLITKNIIDNLDVINEMYKVEYGLTLSKEDIKTIFEIPKGNNYGNLDEPFVNNFGRVSTNMTAYGIVGLVVNYSITLNQYLEIVKVCLATRNNLIINPYLENKTLELFVRVINKALDLIPGFNDIVVTDQGLIYENLDLLLYIGRKGTFEALSCECEKIYIGVNQYELYVHEVLDQKLIDYCKEKGVKIYYDNDHLDVYHAINNQGGNYCSAIMTSSKEKSREFIQNVKSSHILVNMSPLLITSVNLYPEQLLKRKTTIIHG